MRRECEGGLPRLKLLRGESVLFEHATGETPVPQEESREINGDDWRGRRGGYKRGRHFE